MKSIMALAISQHGISVLYKCYSLKKGWGRRCKDKYTDKCYDCKYCRAEMSGKDARKLLNLIDRTKKIVR